MVEKKKILYIITKSNWGGAQRYVFDLATEASKNTYNVVVALGGEGILKQKLENSGIRVVAIPALERDISFVKDIASFIKIVKLLRSEKPDVVHLNSSKIGILGVLAGRIYNTLKTKDYRLKTIFTSHGWVFTEQGSWLSQKTLKFLQWITVLLSHQTIAVSEGTKSEIVSLPFMPSKICVIHNGIRDIVLKEKQTARKELTRSIFRPHELSHELSHEIIHEALWIGIIAELHKNKGLEYAIHAFFEFFNNQNLPVYLVIIGDGEEKTKLEQLVLNKKIENNVFLVGHKNDAASYLNAFDIFLLPSIKEGFPYTILEAGKAGLPVVASNVGGISDIVTHQKSGLLTEPKNVSELTSALKTMVENSAQRKNHGDSLRKRVNRDFSHKKMLEKTFSCYS